MIDRERQLAKPLRVGRTGKAVLSLVTLALVAGIVVLFAAGGSGPRKGCVEVVFSSTLGAARIEKCGAAARELCAHPDSISGIAPQVRAACRRADIAA
jgi:predicted lysophospholipase L1 biosynthesis ABC-type transport system permease subunit